MYKNTPYLAMEGSYKIIKLIIFSTFVLFCISSTLLSGIFIGLHILHPNS